MQDIFLLIQWPQYFQNIYLLAQSLLIQWWNGNETATKRREIKRGRCFPHLSFEISSQKKIPLSCKHSFVSQISSCYKSSGYALKGARTVERAGCDKRAGRNPEDSICTVLIWDSFIGDNLPRVEILSTQTVFMLRFNARFCRVVSLPFLQLP